MSEHVLVDRVGGREYRLVRRLGEGGFGEVYLAQVRTAGGLDQRVAVKLILPDTDARADAVQRLRDEAAVLARLHHPVILAAHDLVELDSRVALVTEYVEGQDLRECIKDKADPIPLGALVEVLGQVAGALEAAWTSHRIVHRDIKPANIRIGRHANVKLLDFGIAKSAETNVKTQADIVMGSLLYLAPERFDANRPAHPVADVFALGCILYERVAGVRLFNKVDAAQLYGLARSSEAFDAYVGRRLEVLPAGPARELARRTLTRDPELRISASDLAAACDALVRELPADQTLR
ncbi:MAG: serine/threonine-protein kinase, partial [Myxococcota bacterium]